MDKYDNIEKSQLISHLKIRNTRRYKGVVAFLLVSLSTIFVIILSTVTTNSADASPSNSNVAIDAGSSDMHKYSLQGSDVPLFIEGTSLTASFCKTSCKSPCSTFPSVYGELCCDWSISSDGQLCALNISPAGICTCGAPPDASDVISDPTRTHPVPAPFPASAPLPVPKKPEQDSTPVSHPTAVPVNNAQHGFQPFPTMAWIPFPEFPKWNPYPTMAWLPFNPIKVPENGTPCKKECKHACGWSQSNGESVCCETSPSGGCDMTQINGECFCG